MGLNRGWYVGSGNMQWEVNVIAKSNSSGKGTILFRYLKNFLFDEWVAKEMRGRVVERVGGRRVDVALVRSCGN